MTKKEYMKPTLKVVELHQKHQILVGSVDQYGMKRSLQNEEVEKGWVKRNTGCVNWDDDWSE